MGDDSKRFRKRARECRALAKDAKSQEWSRALQQIAAGLETEADIFDAEERRKAKP